jgi:cyclically-permuted mutarotase family protein
MIRTSLPGSVPILIACAAAGLAVTADWVRSTIPPPPGQTKQLGVARPFYGVSGGVFLLAGGSNFPDKPPAEGGARACRDEIYMRLPDGEWRSLERRLPEGPVAEGISITTPKGIVCVGGTDGRRDLDAAFLMAWNREAGEVTFGRLPPLPKTIRMGVGAAWEDQVYVACGQQDGAAANGVWRLDLDDVQAGWIALPPVPGVAREQAVGAIAVRGPWRPAFHVFGGNGVEPNGRQAALLDGYFYDLMDGDSGAWKPAAPVKPTGSAKPISVLGGSAIGGRSRILCVGGFDKEVWDEAVRSLNALKGDERAAYLKDYLTRPLAAFRWNRRLLVYDAEKDAWGGTEAVPEARCGAAMALLPDGSLIIASGEDKPGSRSPAAFVRQPRSRRTR